MNTFSSTSETRARENRQELGFEDNHKSLRTRNAMLLAGASPLLRMVFGGAIPRDMHW